MNNIHAVARAEGFEEFVSALRIANLIETLEGAGPFTVFAPSDEVFETDDRGAIRKLLNGGRTRLRAVLKNHIASGKVVARQFAGKRIRAVTLGGGSVVIEGRNGLSVNGAQVILPDLQASNGVIHGIDGLLWPAVEPAA
jgi:uncharacterized surface protein with fasciclin (FAS1) repeats